MSKVFYDDYINLNKLNKLINESVFSLEEKEEIWKIVDEIVHHRVLTVILNNLGEEYHVDFLEKFQSAPHDAEIFDFLDSKIQEDLKELLESEIDILEEEILGSLTQSDSDY